MGKELAREFPTARRVFEEADEALRLSLSRMCFEGPEEELRLTANTQPATLATSIAALRAFQSECGAAAELAAGHSLGEYSALVAAGAITLADALRAVRERGRQVSIGGEIAVPANLNAPGQIVVSGNAGAVRRALEIAKARGGGASVELKVSAPFHCPLMQPARDGMAPVLEDLDVRPLNFGVIANVTAEVNRDPARVKPLLLEQITAPVRWEESMGTLVQGGIESAVEFGAGRVLAGLMRRINRNVKVLAAEDAASLKTTIAALSQ